MKLLMEKLCNWDYFDSNSNLKSKWHGLIISRILSCAWATLDSFLQQPRRLVIAFIARNFECLPFILLLKNAVITRKH